MDQNHSEVDSGNRTSVCGIIQLQHRVSFLSLAQWSPDANVAGLIAVKGKQFSSIGGNAILNDAYFMPDSADFTDGTGQVWLDTSSTATTLNVEETLLAAEQGLVEILDSEGVPLTLRALHEAVLHHPTSARAFPSPISGISALFAYRHFRNASLIAHRLPRYSLAFLLLPQRDALAADSALTASSRRAKGATVALCSRWTAAAALAIFNLCVADVAADVEAAAVAAASAAESAAPISAVARDETAAGSSASVLSCHAAHSAAAAFGPPVPPPLWRHPAAEALTDCSRAFGEYAAVCPAVGPNVFADAVAAVNTLLSVDVTPAASSHGDLTPDPTAAAATPKAAPPAPARPTAAEAACFHDVFAVWGGSAQFRRSSPPPPVRLILVFPVSTSRSAALAAADALWRLLRAVAALAAQLAWATLRQEQQAAAQQLALQEVGAPLVPSANAGSNAGAGGMISTGSAAARAAPLMPQVGIAQCYPQGKVLVVDYTRTGD